MLQTITKNKKSVNHPLIFGTAKILFLVKQRPIIEFSQCFEAESTLPRNKPVIDSCRILLLIKLPATIEKRLILRSDGSYKSANLQLAIRD